MGKTTNQTCMNCKYYRRIDSGYGHCVRYPQRLVLTQWFPRIFYEALYPHVEWDELVCGEFEKGP